MYDILSLSLCSKYMGSSKNLYGKRYIFMPKGL